MSAPNKSYDPVEVEALKPEEIAARLDEALAAIAAADGLEALREVKVAHTGDRSPLALANREIGALPPHAKADAGKRVGQAAAGSTRRSRSARRSWRRSATPACWSRRRWMSRCPTTAPRPAPGTR